MFSCSLHNWFSEESPCPACKREITAEGDLPINTQPFEWTDDLVIEFMHWSMREAPTYQGRYEDIKQFKDKKIKGIATR